jgi:MoxR-like ATPase
MQPNLEELAHLLQSIRAEAGKVILGQTEVIDRSIIAILIGQHALIEGVPGVAKTLLVRTLAHILGCEFSRVQFTPDLMPADITGTSVFNFQSSEFTLMPGPIFTTFLLADEINRAPAKTQSALLQAMQERTVSIDRHSYALSPAFTVFATQNPIEYEGTYPLAEAQKDRFAMKISMTCPEREDELNLARRMLGQNSPEATLNAGGVQPLLTPERLVEARATLDQLAVREEMLGYILDLVRATRTHEAILVGAGPRATQSLLLTSRASAALAGNDFVSPDDVRSMLVPVLEHRLILRPEYEIEGRSIAEVLQQIIQSVPVPR